jgi:hypothetical protein
MGTPTGFHPDAAWWYIRDEGQQCTSGDALPKDHMAGVIHPDDVKDELGDIDAESGELRNALLRRFAFIGGAQEGNVTGLLDHQEVFERVMLLLAAVIFFLFLRIFRTLDGPFRTIMPKRGDGEGTSGLCFASSAVTSSAVRAGRRSWSANVRFNTACNR